MEKRLYRNDILLTAAVFAVCLCLYGTLFWTRKAADGITVTKDGNFVAEYSLSKDGEYSLLDGRYRLKIQNGTAVLTESDCPDGLCRDMKIERGKGQIVCLPERLRIAPSRQKTADLRVG